MTVVDCISAAKSNACEVRMRQQYKRYVPHDGTKVCSVVLRVGHLMSASESCSSAEP